MFFSSHDEFGGSNVAGGGLVAMVVVQRVARVREERCGALWGSAPPVTTMAPFGRLKWLFCVYFLTYCAFFYYFMVYIHRVFRIRWRNYM